MVWSHSLYGWVIFHWYMYIYTPHPLYSSVDGHLGCLHVLVIVNSSAINTGVHVSFQIRVFSGYMPRSGIAGFYGNAIFSFLKNRHTILLSGSTNLHSHQQCRSIPFFPQPFQHLLLVEFPMMAILTGVRWYFTAVLICAFLTIIDAQHSLIYLLAICMSSLEKCLFRSSAHTELYKLCINFGN